MSKTTTPDLAASLDRTKRILAGEDIRDVYHRPNDGSAAMFKRWRKDLAALLDAYAEQGRKLEAAEADRKSDGVARFCDAETIAELMENGARTWMPIGSAQPVKNGSIIVMTSDDEPVIGEAFWHEHGEGVWALHWQACSPKDEPWNDPISETNKPIIAWQPMPEGVPAQRVEQLSTAKEATSSLMVDLEKARETIADLQYRLNSAEFGDTEQKAAIAALTAEVEEMRKSWTIIHAASQRSERLFGGRMSEVTRVFESITLIASRHLTTQGEG